MTANPNELISTIKHERMRVILTEEKDFEQRLNGKPAAAEFVGTELWGSSSIVRIEKSKSL